MAQNNRISSEETFTSSDSVVSEGHNMIREMESETLNTVGCVSFETNSIGFITVWANGIQSVYFQQSPGDGRIQKGSMVSVTAEYSSSHQRYNAITVNELILNPKNLAQNISSVGVVSSNQPKIVMDIATGMAIRFYGNTVEGPPLKVQDIVHFHAVLDPDKSTPYRATRLHQSKLTSPQFGLVVRAPRVSKPGTIKTFCNGSVMTASFTMEHSPHHVDRFQRVVFDADIEPNSLNLKVSSLEILDVPSKLERKRKEAKGVIIKDSGNQGLILDTTDFMGVAFDLSRWLFSVGCHVIYSAETFNQSVDIYQAAEVRGANTECCAVSWNKETVELLKQTIAVPKAQLKKDTVLEQKAVDYLVNCLKKHKTIIKEKLSGYLSQASREVQILLNTDVDEFLQTYKCYFQVSPVGAITLRTVGEFHIRTETSHSKLVANLRDSITGTGFCAPVMSAGAKSLEGNSAAVIETKPVTNLWNTGKTVEKLFGSSSQTHRTIESNPSKPVKLLPDWEVAARHFIMERLEIYGKIYLMNLHSHMQYASEIVQNRLRGQDSQRQFLLRHKDVFTFDDADLISLRRQVATNVRPEVHNESGLIVEPVKTIDAVGANESTQRDQQPLKASETACGEVDWPIHDSNRGSSSCRHVIVLSKPNPHIVSVTQLEFEALEYITTKFVKHEIIPRSKLFGHFGQSNERVKPIYRQPTPC